MNALPPRIKRDSGKKNCVVCGVAFDRPAKLNNARWERTTCCSLGCGNQKPMAERLKARTIPGPNECWNWTSAKDADGYGRIIATRKGVRSYLRAHRAAYEVWAGPIPAGQIVLHSCDNPSCINPAHLRTGTHAENAADKMERGRVSRLGVLVADDVRAIRASRLPAAQLADRYGVTRGSIKNARNGKTWSNVA